MSTLATISNVARGIRRAIKLTVAVEYPGIISVVTPDGELYNIGDVNDTWNADHFANQALYEGGKAGDWIDLIIPVSSEDAGAIADAFLTHLLAVEFGRVLRRWLTPDQVSLANTRNAGEYKDSGACASHDFCDANMAMAEAFDTFGLPTDIDLPESGGDSDAVRDNNSASIIWNNAWTKAKESKFAL
jgi:hypothetical protein